MSSLFGVLAARRAVGSEIAGKAFVTHVLLPTICLYASSDLKEPCMAEVPLPSAAVDSTRPWGEHTVCPRWGRKPPQCGRELGRGCTRWLFDREGSFSALCYPALPNRCFDSLPDRGRLTQWSADDNGRSKSQETFGKFLVWMSDIYPAPPSDPS